MIDLKELNKIINYLNTLKDKEEKEQLEKVRESIRKELVKELEDTLKHFESECMLEFIENSKRNVCFDYNFNDVINSIKETINVDVWEVE